jgi:hypothetical protein
MTETLVVDDNRIFAPVQVGQNAGYAHLDTGARYSTISQSYTEGLPWVGSRQVHGALEETEVAQVRLETFSFLGETYGDVALDVKPDAVGGLDTLPFKVIMALGCDTLLQKRLRLDLARNEIGFLEDTQATTGSCIEADFGFFGMPFFRLGIGTRTLHALLDTGAAMSVLNPRLLTELEDTVGEGEELEVEDATGAKHMIPTFECQTLHIGAIPLGECQVLAIDLEHAKRELNTQIDFVFGVNAMMDREWIIDRPRKCLEIREE